MAGGGEPDVVEGHAWQVGQTFKETIARAPLGMGAKVAQDLWNLQVSTRRQSSASDS